MNIQANISELLPRRVRILTAVLLIIGAVGVLIPFSVLAGIFHYPDILREDTSMILTKFHQGGSSLIFTWLAFGLAGLPMIPAYILMGRMGDGNVLVKGTALLKVATTTGLIGLLVQLIGLLRWVFVVPILADSFADAPDEATRSAAIIAFKIIHQFAGVLLGEHIGQLFTIGWTVMISVFFYKHRYMPRWLSIMGIVSGLIYCLAQLELLATVIPGIPAWGSAGFIGSTLWLLWLVMLAVVLIVKKDGSTIPVKSSAQKISQ